ncbi:MAG: indole-3-glycerol phosphate synthase TrpC [Candidatus Sumerlaeia bacterium]|nr:indole-3-glycerol phosphate synthase TrpC [Candidatus Sumerlaeia bacterium]
MTILDAIIATKRDELAAAQAAVPPAEMERRALAEAPPRDFAGALRGPDLAVIAEIKRASPSAGIIRLDFDPGAIARSYEAGGASALSVLTDVAHFQGSLDFLRAARGAAAIPALRKDFTTDPYHLFEARAHGADAVLLIVAVLTDPLLRDLVRLAGELGMAALVEVHDPAESDRALEAGARLLGINNRDLRTFHTDLAQTERVMARLPSRGGLTVISESGIRTAADLRRLEDIGVDAVLIGEHLMRAPDPGAALRRLLDDLRA